MSSTRARPIPRLIHPGSTNRSSISKASPPPSQLAKPTISPSASAARVRPSRTARSENSSVPGCASRFVRSPSLDNDDLRYTPLNAVMSSATASRIKTPVTPQLRPGPASPPIDFAVSGLGAGEAERHTLAEPEGEQIVRTEVAERQAAAYSYNQAGRSDQAERLRREASVLISVRPAPLIGALPLVTAAAGGRDPAEGLAGGVAKMVVQRDRPAETLPDVILRGQSAAHGLSCPSGHAMVIFAITALVAPYFKGW